MKKAYLNQREAAAEIAYLFSDVIEFDSGFFTDARAGLETKRDERIPNLFGQQTKIENCEGTEDVLGVMYGAMKGGAVASGFLKDNGSLALSRIVNRYCVNDLPGVFYVATDDSNVCSYDICKKVGMVFPATAQEAIDLSALAHLCIGKSYKPFVVAMNGRRAAGVPEEVEVPEFEDFKENVDLVAFCGTRARGLKRGISCDIEVPLLLEAELPEIVNYYLGLIAEKWGRSYKLVDYVGAEDAEKVFISAGANTPVIEKAVLKMAEAGEKVGLVKVKVLAPFNQDVFAAQFPKTAKKAVLVGQTAGSCPNNAFFQMVKEAVPEMEWAEDAFAIGRNDVTEECVALAFAAMDMEAPKASNGNDKYFAQGMDGVYFDKEKAVFDLGKKRWVVANSIGANNVNFGLGMISAFEQRREWILNEVLFLADNTIYPSVSDRGYEYLEVKDDTEKSLPALEALLADKVGEDTHCSTCTNIRQELEFLDKKYFWIYAGDARLADLDWKAIRKALTSGEDVNIFCVQDKEIYKKAADRTGALDVFFRTKNIDGVCAKTITLDMEAEKIESILHQAETHYGPSIVVLFV